MSEKKSTSTALAWTVGTKMTIQRLINQHKANTQGNPDTIDSYVGRLESLKLPCGTNGSPHLSDSFVVSSDEDSPQIKAPSELSKSREAVGALVQDDIHDLGPLLDTSIGDSDNHAEDLNTNQCILEPTISTPQVAVESFVPDGGQGGKGDNDWLNLG